MPTVKSTARMEGKPDHLEVIEWGELFRITIVSNETGRKTVNHGHFSRPDLDKIARAIDAVTHTKK